MSDNALDTVEGAALATEIVDMLESELVRFQHRVAHDHGIELDRARAALVLLGKLIGAGVTWTAKPDSDPTKIYKVFESMKTKHPELAPALKKEIAAWFVATTDVEVADDPTRTPATILRRAGAEPSLWWWATDHPDPARCWAACSDRVDASIQVALAFGAPVDRVARSLANAFALLASRVKTRQAPQRTALVTALGADDRAAITKLAFEMRFKDPEMTDPVAELSIHAFQLVEALEANTGAPDVERFGTLARRANRMFATRGLQLAAMVRAELEAVVQEAIASLPA